MFFVTQNRKNCLPDIDPHSQLGNQGGAEEVPKIVWASIPITTRGCRRRLCFAVLKKDARELDLLFRDLLIGVTQFFWDPEAFEVLATSILRKLVERAQNNNEHVRIWVPACATGEEAYSIAILMRDRYRCIDSAK